MLALFRTLAVEAGRRILEIRQAGPVVAFKIDGTPVTAADRQAEEIILGGLRRAYPGVHCVAEEESAQNGRPSALGDAFILVDPLDGTREFIGGSAEFTVNIALIRDAMPVLGAVYAPALGELYAGHVGSGAEFFAVGADFACAAPRSLTTRRTGDGPLRIVASRSHRTRETDAFIARFAGARLVAIGSSLKFCRLAAGEADVYPRFGPTMEWDTAAGDAVLRAAGGCTVVAGGGGLAYGKCPTTGKAFANPWFVAAAESAECLEAATAGLARQAPASG